MNEVLTERQFLDRAVAAAPHSRWQLMSKAEKLAAIKAILEERPNTKYAEIGRELGTSKEAVGALLFRAGEAKAKLTNRVVLNSAQPLIKKLFQYAKQFDVSDVQLAMRSGYAVETMWNMRMATRGTYLKTFVEIAEALGLEIELRPKQ